MTYGAVSTYLETNNELFILAYLICILYFLYFFIKEKMMIKLSKVNIVIGFLIGVFGTLCFLVLAYKTIDERFKNLVYLIFLCLLLLFIIISFLITLKEKEYRGDIWDIEYIKDNLSREQWKDYKNTIKKLNPSEKQIYTRELLEIIEEKKELELEKFTDKTKSELSKWKI